MFTKLENCSPEFLSEWHEDVLSIQMSPHDLLNSVKVNLDANTEKKVVMCAGVKDIKAGRGKALHPPDRDALELAGTPPPTALLTSKSCSTPSWTW